MFNLTYDEIVTKLKEEKNLSEDEINTRVKDKLRQLSDLISKEGAAHIVANELGVNIVNLSREVKVNKLIDGMSNVTLIGKVIKLNEIIKFNRNGKGGKVVSFMFGDETGMVRGVFWDVNHIKEVESGNLKEGVILKIKNGYVRLNNGYKEVHLGSRGEMEINPAGVVIDNVSNNIGFDFVKKKISELNEGDLNVGVFGTIVQVFELKFYEACSVCGKKVEIDGEQRQCKEHGNVNVEYVPILNLFFDDGTESLKAVAFRNQAIELLGVSKKEILEMKGDLSKFEEAKQDLLGKQLFLIGRTVKNGVFDTKEMTIQRVLEVSPEQLIHEIEK